MNSEALYFAGSFNPIHHGHLLVARAAAKAANLSRIILMPSRQNPLKQEVIAPAADRLAMCQLAIQDIAQFAVSDLELNRPAPSYTIDTVRALKVSDASKIHWLLGADQLITLPNWRNIDQLLAEVHFLIANRPGVPIDWQTLPPMFHFLQSHLINAPLIDISATEIRARLAASLPIDYLTPPSVVRYIAEHRLYR